MAYTIYTYAFIVVLRHIVMVVLARKDPSNSWTQEQVESILDVAKVRFGREAYLLFKCLWVSGRRVGEVLGTRPTLARYNRENGIKVLSLNGRDVEINYRFKTLDGLKVKDIVFEKAGIVWNIEKKREPKRVFIAMSKPFLVELRGFIVENGLKSDDRVFSFSIKKAERMLKVVLGEAKYMVDGSPIPVRKGSLHTFRHSFTDFAKKRISVPDLMHHLQHSRVDVTMSYVHPSEDYADQLYLEM
jgi:integrase